MDEKLNPIAEAEDLLKDACVDFQYFFNMGCMDSEKFILGMNRMVSAIKLIEGKAFCEQCGDV